MQWQNKSWKNNFKSHCTYYLQPLLLKHSRLFFLLKRKSCGREEGIWNDSHIWHVLNNFNTKESMNFEFLSRQKTWCFQLVYLTQYPNTKSQNVICLMFRFFVKSFVCKTSNNSKTICRVDMKFGPDTIKLVIEIAR